jgi:mono/diheme cytochrome c family protein
MPHSEKLPKPPVGINWFLVLILCNGTAAGVGILYLLGFAITSYLGKQSHPESALPAGAAVAADSVPGGSAPVAYAPEQELTLAEGEGVINTNCAVCHQLGATGKVGFAPSIRNRDFLALALDEFIFKTVKGGRPGTAMPPRPDLPDAQIRGVISYLRSVPVVNPVEFAVDPYKQFHGDPEAGQGTYHSYCAPCHGEDGKGYSEGGSGPGIGMPGFLAVASDDFIFQTVKHGRIGTPMRPFMGARGLANLSEEEVHDVIAYLRSLEPEDLVAAGITFRANDPEIGRQQFDINCSSCHQIGGVGKVGFAPSIRNRDFLAIATDGFIKSTIRNGRIGTAMVARPDLSEQTVE